MDDLISRQEAIDALDGNVIVTSRESAQAVMDYIRGCADRMRSLPPAQPEPISEEYAKAVECWLMTYQIKCAELRGRYTPYEILGWIVSDWRKENEIW